MAGRVGGYWMVNFGVLENTGGGIYIYYIYPDRYCLIYSFGRFSNYINKNKIIYIVHI